jgi:hypothetical protein
MKRIVILLSLATIVFSQDTLIIKSGVVYLGEVKGISNTIVKFQLIGGINAQQVQLKTVSKIINSSGEILYDSKGGPTSTIAVQEAELTYEQTQNIEFTKNIANNTKYNSYQTKDGTLIKIGDPLVVGTPATGDKQYTEYIGTHEVFSTITVGGLGMTILAGPSFLPATAQGSVFIVEKISANHTKLSKKSPVGVTVTAIEPDAPSIMNKRTIGNLEKAILLGEIISPNAPMTRAEAIAKLKESKELLDLEIISQEEYDNLKVELTPIIRGD